MRSRKLVSFEPVEMRLLFAVLPVLNTNDAGEGSLRDVIAAANAGDTVDLTQVTGTITVESEITIDKALTINGPGEGSLTLSGGNQTRVLNLASTADVAISNLTFKNGASSDGGAINNQGALELDFVTFEANRSSHYGGAIYNTGALNVADSSFRGNSVDQYSSSYADGRGGAVWSGSDQNISFERCDFANNSVTTSVWSYYHYSGDAAARGGALFIGGNGQSGFANCTFVQNSVSSESISDYHYYYYGESNATSHGGALFYEGAVGLSMTNCTVYGNSSTAYANNYYYGGYANYGSGGLHIGSQGTVTITNTIVQGNTAGYDRDVWNDSNTTWRSSLVGNIGYNPSLANGVNGNIVGDNMNLVIAGISELATVNGRTVAPLGEGSAAINAADAEYAPATDARGYGRVGAPDIGAYEYDGAAPVTNNKPLFTSIAPTEATADLLFTYDITTAEADEGDTRTITASSNLPEWLTLTDHGDGTATLTGTPSNADAGDASFSVSVTDGKDTSTQDVTLSVAAVNHAPAITSVAPTAATSESEFSYAITTSDPEPGDTLTITASDLPSWLTLTDHGDGTADLTGTPTNNNAGEVSFVLTVSDGEKTGTQTVTLTVGGVNHAPTFTSAAPTAAVTSEQPFSYSITTSDSDHNAVNITIVEGANHSWLTLVDNGDGTATLSGTPTNANAGTVEVVIRVSDGTDSSTQTLEFSVTAVNHAPTLPSSLAAMQAIAFTPFMQVITAGDVDPETHLSFNVILKPAWLTVTDNGDGTATLTGIPTAADNGASSLTLSVSDGDKSAQQTYAIEVTTPRWTFDKGVLGVYGSAANDNIQVWTKGNQVRVVRNGVTKNFPLAGLTGIEIYGFDGDDMISTNTRNVPVYALGNAHNDTLTGGDEADNFVGGGGKDSLTGGGGDDRLDGFTGNDVLVGGLGTDRLIGGAGDDTLLARDKAVDSLNGGDGNDSAQLDSLLDVKEDLLSLIA